MTIDVLDLYCKQGGASFGFMKLGWHVTGVDIEDQPRYCGNIFIKSDAIKYLEENYYKYDIIFASPPCQEYSKSSLQFRVKGKKYPDLIEKTRDALIKTQKHYIIENVPNSPLINPIYLNGSYFGILVHRPRYFESNWFIEQPKIPKTNAPIKMGRKVEDGEIIQPVGHFVSVDYARKQMGINWMNREGLSNAIPPVYTEWIGEQYLKYIKKQ